MARGIKSEAVQLDQIFSGRASIHVPRYQRGFSWRGENIVRLWDDLLEVLAENAEDRTLFLGSLVFHEEEEMNLVDGQQRLTTVSLVLAALRHRINGHQPKSNKHGRILTRIEDLLFINGNPEDGPRLRLSQKDQSTFEKVVQKGQAGAGSSNSLRRGWNTVRDLVDKDIPDDKLLEASEHLVAMMKSTVTFSRVVVAEPYNPFVVFEALNSTGEDLAQSDLIKNRVLQRADERDRDKLAETWDRMVATLPDGTVSEYLRAWWLANYEFTSAKKLYSRVKKRVTDKRTVADFVDRWHEDAKTYKAVYEGRADGRRSPQLKAALADFAQLGFRQGRPVVLAFLLSGGESEVPDAVRQLSRIYVRVLKTAQQRGSKFEAIIDDICAKTRESPAEGLGTLRTQADRLIAETGPIDWEHFHVEQPDFARYLLTQLAREEEGPMWNVPSTAEVEIEHVLPRERPEGLLPSLKQDEYDRLTTHIGNLTFLTKEDNASIMNRPPLEKRATYRKYSIGPPKLGMTGELASMANWDDEAIRARGKRLAVVAERVWPSRA